jgi:hypothetical protein
LDQVSAQLGSFSLAFGLLNLCSIGDTCFSLANSINHFTLIYHRRHEKHLGSQEDEAVKF